MLEIIVRDLSFESLKHTDEKNPMPFPCPDANPMYLLKIPTYSL